MIFVIFVVFVVLVIFVVFVVFVVWSLWFRLTRRGAVLRCRTGGGIGAVFAVPPRGQT